MSEKEFDIRMPSELMKAPLPHWVKIIWMSAKSYQGDGDCCWAGYKKIGERIVTETSESMNKSQVQRGVNLLLKTPFLSRNKAGKLVCFDPRKGTPIVYPQVNIGVHPEYTGGTPIVNGGYTHSVPGVHPESTPSKSQHKANKKANIKTNKRALPEGLTYDQVFDSWNTVASELGFPLVESRSDKRKQKILSLAAKLWPRMERTYENMRNGNRWFREDLRPGFDWVWNETNFNKIYEGNYLHERNGNHASAGNGKSGTLEDDFNAAFAELHRSHGLG